MGRSRSQLLLQLWRTLRLAVFARSATNRSWTNERDAGTLCASVLLEKEKDICISSTSAPRRSFSSSHTKQAQALFHSSGEKVQTLKLKNEMRNLVAVIVDVNICSAYLSFALFFVFLFFMVVVAFFQLLFFLCGFRSCVFALCQHWMRARRRGDKKENFQFFTETDEKKKEIILIVKKLCLSVRLLRARESWSRLDNHTRASITATFV